MKKLIIAICMFSSLVYSQDKDKDNYFSASWGFDVKNGFVGSKPTGNEPALDWTADLHFVSDDVDYNVGYEQFDAIKFDRRYVSVGYHFYISDLNHTPIRFSIQPSIELSNIGRRYNETYIGLDGLKHSQEVPNSWFTPSLNVNWNWDIGKYFAIQLATNWLPRPDTRDIYHLKHNKYVTSVGFKTVIKIPW